jgi:hypothetical protein
MERLVIHKPSPLILSKKRSSLGVPLFQRPILSFFSHLGFGKLSFSISICRISGGILEKYKSPYPLNIGMFSPN